MAPRKATVTLPDAHALTIGVSQYRHLRPLPVTRDAQDIAGALCDESLCGYPSAHVRSLIESEATREAVLDELDRLVGQTTDRSNVFVYFSGHGGGARGGDTCYLMPVDGRDGDEAALAATAISGTELSARLRRIRAARLTVVLDCCRASGVARPRDPRDSGDLRAEPRDVEPGVLAPDLPRSALAALAGGRSRAVLAASRSDGHAYVVPGARNGVFTGYLLDGLRGAAAGAGGVIRICDLFTHVQQRIAQHGGQQPVFHAELEENYPVSLYRGGLADVVVPPAPDDLDYDVFISYRHADRTDRQFVLGVVAPELQRLGLRVCLEHVDFRLGAPRIQEIERAVTRSRYTVGVFTPSYLDGVFEELQADLARFQSVESRSPRFIPLLRRDCRLALGVRMTALLDVTDDKDVEAALQRLAVQLREPPRPRLAAT
jgi:Caspase domain/TIR domain